ncbi:inactive CLIP domain-containing serine protease A3-like [Panulirus ornatus]|uniref:inactive CLIP domain-containing serine protease A3-like n=1 Tax=Panulirus ornatus TaxID=150431 RepID=UPI003A8ABA9C
MRAWVSLFACVALAVSVEGQRHRNDEETRLGLLAEQLGIDPVPGGQTGTGVHTGREVCYCQPLNQFCFREVTSSRAGPSSSTLQVNVRNNNLRVDTRIVNRPSAGECPGEKKCCFKDNDAVPTTSSPITTPLGCGIQNPIPYRQAAQAEATFGEYPWMAILLSFADDYKGGGALIAENWVLTAAHKVYQERSLKVRLGDLDVTSPQDHSSLRHIEVPVSRIVVHPRFDSKTLVNDIALLQLQQPVNTRQYPHIGTVCLPNQRQLFEAERTDVCYCVRWALVMVSVVVMIIRCISLVSVMSQGAQGDGGAPLVCNVGRGWTVVGLVAWGIGCAQDDVPGVYANVANLRSFIREIAGI